MKKRLKSHTAEFKLKVALEALKNEKTVSQIASDFVISSSQVTEWKQKLIKEGAEVFQRKNRQKNTESHENIEYLQQQVGKLTVQLEWLKKKQGITP